jgi:phage-related tail protein
MTTERWTDESLDRFAATITTAIAANNEAIAASNERLTRIEQLQGSNAEAIAANTSEIAASNKRLTKTEQIVESNARAIQALLDSMGEERAERHELREATIRLSGVSEGIANLLSSLDSAIALPFSES